MRLIQHHKKYKEIHGVDEIVMMTRSEHSKLHIRLRREGKCNVPVDELKKISGAARGRTEQSKEYLKKYVALADMRTIKIDLQAHRNAF